ncbi:MAG TPA: hypothetical protein VKV26_24470 [Dehalococcoidia bacterium]|nr:hypothetical protein [Dehalococcoidia bacterium]
MTLENTMYGGLTPGTPIFTMDGDQIGKVKEVRDRFFKVDASAQPDYWLATDCIRSASAGRVRVGFDKDHLGDYKVNGPKRA